MKNKHEGWRDKIEEGTADPLLGIPSKQTQIEKNGGCLSGKKILINCLKTRLSEVCQW